MDSRKSQTVTVSLAEPGDFPLLVNPTATYVALSRQVGESSSTQSYERSTHFFQERNSLSLTTAHRALPLFLYRPMRH